MDKQSSLSLLPVSSPYNICNRPPSQRIQRRHISSRRPCQPIQRANLSAVVSPVESHTLSNSIPPYGLQVNSLPELPLSLPGRLSLHPDPVPDTAPIYHSDHPPLIRLLLAIRNLDCSWELWQEEQRRLMHALEFERERTEGAGRFTPRGMPLLKLPEVCVQSGPAELADTQCASWKDFPAHTYGGTWLRKGEDGAHRTLLLAHVRGSGRLFPLQELPDQWLRDWYGVHVSSPES